MELKQDRHKAAEIGTIASNGVCYRGNDKIVALDKEQDDRTWEYGQDGGAAISRSEN